MFHATWETPVGAKVGHFQSADIGQGNSKHTGWSGPPGSWCMGKHLTENLLNYLFRKVASEFPYPSFLYKNESTSLFINVGYLGHTSNCSEH